MRNYGAAQKNFCLFHREARQYIEKNISGSNFKFYPLSTYVNTNKEEFDKFVDILHDDEDFRVECFVKNVNRDNLNLASDITIK